MVSNIFTRLYHVALYYMYLHTVCSILNWLEAAKSGRITFLATKYFFLVFWKEREWIFMV